MYLKTEGQLLTHNKVLFLFNFHQTLMKVKNDRQISVNILFSLDKISGFEFRDYDLSSLCRLKKSKCSDYIRFRHGIKLTQ